MKFDDILDHIGEFGTYQRVIVSLLYLPCMFCALQALSYVFISAVPRYRCYVDGCDNSSTKYYEDFVNSTNPWEVDSNEHPIYSRCHLYAPLTNGTQFVYPLSNQTCPAYTVDRNNTVDCNLWKFDDSSYHSTLVTEWSLVCSKSHLVALSQAMYMAGVMAGSIVYGYISDRFGRKTALLLGLSLGTTLSTVLCWVPYHALLLTFRFFIGACFQGIYQTTFVMTMELVGKSKRAVCGMLASVVYAVGEIVLGFASYGIRDWKTLQLVISAPAFMFVMYYWLIPESPRWLLLKNRKNEALTVLENIASSNEKDLPAIIFNSDDEETNELDLNINRLGSNQEVRSYNWLDLFRTPYLRWISFNVLLNWFMNTLAYYGITMSTPMLGGNDWWNFIIISAVEIPACFFGMVSISWLGRRRPLCGCMIIGGIAGTCTALIPSSPSQDYAWLAIVLAMIGKFGAAAAFSIIYVFTAELYPTVIRNNAVGLSSMIGHSGGVVAPYIANLGYVNKALPLVIFGICSLVSGVLSLTLPETTGQQLPETIEDSENLGKRPFAKLRGTEHDERVRLLTDVPSGNLISSVNSDNE